MKTETQEHKLLSARFLRITAWTAFILELLGGWFSVPTAMYAQLVEHTTETIPRGINRNADEYKN